MKLNVDLLVLIIVSEDELREKKEYDDTTMKSASSTPLSHIITSFMDKSTVQNAFMRKSVRL